MHANREETFEVICQALEAGTPLAQICREKAVGVQTFCDWRDADKEKIVRFARAREIGYDAIAADCLVIADTGINDTYIDDDGNKRVDNDVIQRSKLRVETRLKLLAKWSPKKYGEQLQVEHTGSVRAVIGGEDA